MQFALLAAFTAVVGAVGAMGSATLYSPLTEETLAETFYFKFINTERTVSHPKYATSEATLRADPLTFPKGAYQFSVKEVGPSGTVFSDMFPVTLCSPDAC